MYGLSYGYQSVHYVVMYGHLFYFISMFKMFGCTRYLSLVGHEMKWLGSRCMQPVGYV